MDQAAILRELKVNLGLPLEKLSLRLGLTKQRVLNLVGLLDLPEEIKEDIRKKNLTEKHGRALRQLLDQAEILREVFNFVKEKNLTGEQTQELVQTIKSEPRFTIEEAYNQFKELKPQKEKTTPTLKSKTIESFINKVIEGDCLKVMKEFPPKSIDMILCDLPYGTTQNHWDSLIPLDKLWVRYERIVKDTGVIALTSQGLFTAQIMMSNPRLFKYKITWVKSKPTNFLNAKKQPLRKHEDICIFYKKQPIYNPQMSTGEPYNKGFRKDQLTGSYGDFRTVEVKSNGERYPTDVVYFKTAESEGPVFHPTQKPVELGRYLIKTFTKSGDIILDNTCGSGSFLASAVLEGRKFIGIEKNQEVYLFKKKKVDYIEVCNNRIKEAQEQYKAESNKLRLF